MFLGESEKTGSLRRRLRTAVAVGVAVALLCGVTLAVGGLGTGSVAAQSQGPIEISTWTDLADVRDDLNADYVLVNDLDQETMGYESVAGPTANNGRGFNPIGEVRNEFVGSFDGQGNTIRDLIIDRPTEDFVGLFSISSGAIENAAVVNATVTGNFRVGGLVGFNLANVSNSEASGSVAG
ncbi:MAG: GLUG domain protein, partial [halophilic archaeon J07HX5]